MNAFILSHNPKPLPANGLTQQERPRRKVLDLMLYALEQAQGQAKVEAFKREALPHLALSAEAFREVSEEEWEAGITQIRAELPAFLKYVAQQFAGANSIPQKGSV